MKRINEFVIKLATVNGSGSASANTLFAKALFRMGLHVSPKNIFPSNIQGLPTWYEVRVSQAGHMARREGVDVMVAMNPQTYAEDATEVLPGGYLIYDSSLIRTFERDDIEVLPIPIAQMCAKEYKDLRERQLFKNIVYVGALTALLDMDYDIVTQLLEERFKRKPKLIKPNLKALEIGRKYVLETFKCPLPVKVRSCEGTQGKIIMTGNEAAALGCLWAGATVASWYPITPSTSLAEAFEKYSSKLRLDEDGRRRVAVVQAEDELAAIGIAIGAGWNGARAFTATSGPGVSLMSEFLGLAYFAEVPLVLFNVQRGGPSTGMPTRTQQSDIICCAYASHGDTRQVLLIPGDPHECFDFAAQAFDLAERLQTPIIVMSDLDLGMNDWVIDPLVWDDAHKHDRGKVLDAEALEEVEQFGRYLDVDGDAIPYRTIPGTHPTKGAYFSRGSSHDAYARYTERGELNAANLDRLARKFETAAEMMPRPVIKRASKASKLGLINFGSTEPAVREAVGLLKRDGYKLNTMRLRAFPFGKDIAAFAAEHERIFVVEMNRDAQMRTLLIAEAGIPAEKLIPVLSYDGMPMTARQIAAELRDTIESDKSVAQALRLSAVAM
jgi:2-oxoglutarate ferredoxin oxidoreductase subunit alpha